MLQIYRYDRRLPLPLTSSFSAPILKTVFSCSGRSTRHPETGKILIHECRLLMPDGSVKHVHIAAHAVRNQADQLEFVGALIDVTAAGLAEKELRRAQTDLAHATRVTTVGEMTASIAHEVNQPLTGLAHQRRGLLALARPRKCRISAKRAERRHGSSGIAIGRLG